MPTNERVNVSLPADLVRDIDRYEENRSKFLQDAARHELERRRRELFRHSLRAPHPETAELADAGLEEWVSVLTEEDPGTLVNVQAGTEVRWVPGVGWSAVGA